MTRARRIASILLVVIVAAALVPVAYPFALLWLDSARPRISTAAEARHAIGESVAREVNRTISAGLDLEERGGTGEFLRELISDPVINGLDLWRGLASNGREQTMLGEVDVEGERVVAHLATTVTGGWSNGDVSPRVDGEMTLVVCFSLELRMGAAAVTVADDACAPDLHAFRSDAPVPGTRVALSDVAERVVGTTTRESTIFG
jgi:hypothetical protein